MKGWKGHKGKRIFLDGRRQAEALKKEALKKVVLISSQVSSTLQFFFDRPKKSGAFFFS